MSDKELTAAEKRKIKKRKEQEKLLKNKVVIQRNDLIKGDTSVFSVNDLKIFKLIISKVKSNDLLFDDLYEITTDELKALNINERHLYNEVLSSLKKLANIYINIETDDGFREVGLIRNDFRFPKYSKKVQITFNDDMREYLLDIKGNYTKYALLDIVNFKLKHTLKLYEYLKSVDLKVMKIGLDKLKGILDLEGKYSKFSEFKRNVLEPSIKEINEKTETLTINYSLEKKGREVSLVIFHIQRVNTKMNELTIDNSNKYKNLLGKECLYLNKYYSLDSVNLETFTIILKEAVTENEMIITLTNEEQLDDTLKGLYPNENVVIDVKEKVEEDITKIKDFKDFKFKVIDEYKGKDLLNNAPGYLKETVLSIDQNGLLFNTKAKEVISKEKAYAIWMYLYKNRDKVGYIEDFEKLDEKINSFIGKKISVSKLEDKNKVSYIYEILGIDKIQENEYKMLLKEVNGGEIEESKSLLTREQLIEYVENNEAKE